MSFTLSSPDWFSFWEQEQQEVRDLREALDAARGDAAEAAGEREASLLEQVKGQICSVMGTTLHTKNCDLRWRSNVLVLFS